MPAPESRRLSGVRGCHAFLPIGAPLSLTAEREGIVVCILTPIFLCPSHHPPLLASPRLPLLLPAPPRPTMAMRTTTAFVIVLGVIVAFVLQAVMLSMDASGDIRRSVGQRSVASAVPHLPSLTPGCAPRFVVIVGAGPAGLAVASQLSNIGVPFVVLESAASAGSSWRNRYDRLHLHTHRSNSHLPFWPFPDTFPEYVSAQDLADYLEGYAKLLQPHVLYNTRVSSARRIADDGTEDWLVISDDGRQWRAAALVMCTGQESEARLPTIDGLETRFAGTVLHSSSYKNGSSFRGKRALVLGMGNSGAEIALDLYEHGALNVTIVARSPIHVLPRWLANLPFLGSRPWALTRTTPLWISDALYRHIVKHLLYADLPSLGIKLREGGIKSDIHLRHSAPLMDIGTIALVRAGSVRVVGSAVDRFEASGAVFPGDGDEVTPFDVVVLATGFEKSGGAHTLILPAELLPLTLSAFGFVESGPSPAAPALYFAGFTDHSGRLAEIQAESAGIARQIASDQVPPFDRLNRRHELGGSEAHRAATALPVACLGGRRSSVGFGTDDHA